MMDYSIVAIEFEAEEVPFWGNDLSVREMIEKITVYQTKYRSRFTRIVRRLFNKKCA